MEFKFRIYWLKKLTLRCLPKNIHASAKQITKFIKIKFTFRWSQKLYLHALKNLPILKFRIHN